MALDPKTLSLAWIPGPLLSAIVLEDCRFTFNPLASHAIHVTAISWPNDGPLAYDQFFSEGLQITLDAPPVPDTVTSSTMIVAIEGPPAPNALLNQFVTSPYIILCPITISICGRQFHHQEASLGPRDNPDRDWQSTRHFPHPRHAERPLHLGELQRRFTLSRRPGVWTGGWCATRRRHQHIPDTSLGER
jgi:hypothetical protein